MTGPADGQSTTAEMPAAVFETVVPRSEVAATSSALAIVSTGVTSP